MKNEVVATGTDVLRQMVAIRIKKINYAPLAKDLHITSDALVGFAEGRQTLPDAILQALTRELLPHTEFDAALNLLRPTNRAAPTSMGVHPPRFEYRPLDFDPATPQMGPQLVVPAKPVEPKRRAGWLSNWL